jgi:hypothetical protein
MFFIIIKAIYNKPILNGEQLKPFLLKSGMRQGFPHSPLLHMYFGIPNLSKKISARNKRYSNT